MGEKVGKQVVLALKSVGLALAVAAVVVNSLPDLPIEIGVTLVGTGLVALAVASLVVPRETE